MSVLCLCVFENMVFSQPSVWLMHYEGAGKLLQFRGPKAWRNPDERQVLCFARYFAILSAGHRRRHCFLDQPQWESTQCVTEGEAPERIDLLCDIFAQTLESFTITTSFASVRAETLSRLDSYASTYSLS
ncbi:Hypothetical protein NCS54_01509700 [Fusarium falciforme]|uniref:Hypothetical protein n=1 Tax=Fusarium falciforme TaxID=195108 RepID=UPI0023014CBF|nr:Hypothetical protein NCS54_01509700 [Fusarium falciforme]WAO97372.1 Hypothetical protein NCS54_01509700 [Fusarium falciforme]